MKKSFVIISFVAFVSCFVILSHSCGRKSQHETTARFEKALRCYDKALDMYANDSLHQALIIYSLRNKNKFNKRTEQLNSIIAANEFKYSMIDGKIRKMNAELRKKEKIIREKEGELNEIKNKIERIENASDFDAYYNSEICRKIINRRTTDVSALSNEELALLLQTADKHLNNITARLKEKYHKLDKDDMYYICLILLNTEEYNMQYLLKKNRKTVWYRLNKIKTLMNLEKNSDILAFVLNNYIN